MVSILIDIQRRVRPLATLQGEGVSKLTTWKIRKVTFGTVCGSCLQGSCSRGLMPCEASMDSGGGGWGGVEGPMSHFWSLAQWEALGWEADVGGSHFPTSALLFSSNTVIHGHSLAQLVKHQNGSHGCPSYCRNQSSGWGWGGGGGKRCQGTASFEYPGGCISSKRPALVCVVVGAASAVKALGGSPPWRGGGGGGHQKQHNTRMRCLSKCKVVSSVKNGHVPSFPVSE